MRAHFTPQAEIDLEDVGDYTPAFIQHYTQ